MILHETEIVIDQRDWFLIIGVVLAPMTSLRIWKIGPSEMLCFIWAIKYINRYISIGTDTNRFFVGFLLSMTFGLIVCMFIAPDEVSFVNLLTWGYLAFFSSSLYKGLNEMDIEYCIKVFSNICILFTLLYFGLYIYSVSISRYFLNVNLWYGSGIGARFTGGANNPHQLAIIACGMPFWFLYKFLKEKHIIYLLCIGINIFLVLRTRSSTALMALIIGFSIYIIFKTADLMHIINYKIGVLTIEIFLILCVVIFLYDKIYSTVYAWIASDSNGLGRLELFSSFGKSFIRSPIVGLGPGAHSGETLVNGKMYEFHNTYLEILSMTGIVGFSFFVKYSYKLFKKAFICSEFLAILTAMYVYGFAGMAMRKLGYWAFIIFVLSISEKLSASKQHLMYSADNI